MKKYISVFCLIMRESFFKIFALIILSLAVQASLVFFCMPIAAGEEIPSVTAVFDMSKIHIVFYVLITALAVLLCKTGMQFRTSVGYTLKRLRIREESIFFIQCIYNFLIISIAVLLEVILCFYLASFAADNLPEKFITTQSVYLAFYKTQFIQNLFAGRDVLRIIRNIIGMLAFSCNCGALSFLYRRGKKWFGIAIILPIFFRMLKPDGLKLTDTVTDVIIISAFSVLLVSAVAAVFVGREQDEI